MQKLGKSVGGLRLWSSEDILQCEIEGLFQAEVKTLEVLEAVSLSRNTSYREGWWFCMSDFLDMSGYKVHSVATMRQERSYWG